MVSLTVLMSDVIRTGEDLSFRDFKRADEVAVLENRDVHYDEFERNCRDYKICVDDIWIRFK